MKKLFTLLLSLVAFSTVSFANTEMDLSQWGDTGWDSSFDATTYTMTFTSAWGGCGYFIGGKDFSACASLTVTFKTEMTATIKLVVEEYPEGTETSAELTSASITGSGDATVEQSITVDLGDSATNLSQIYIEASATGTLTLVSAVLTPKSDHAGLYTDAIQGGLLLSDWSGTYLGADAASGTPDLVASGLAEAGNIMVFTVADTTTDSSWGFKLVEGHWGATYIAINYYGSDEEDNLFEAYDLATNNGVYAIELTDAIITSAGTGQGWGGEFIVQGDGVTLTKVEIMTADYFGKTYSGISPSLPVLLDVNGYTTFSSSSAVTVSRGTAYKASVSGETVTLTALSGAVPANAGVVLVGTAKGTATIRTTGSATPAADVSGNALIGVTSSSDELASSGTNYVLANDGEITQFVLIGSATIADLVNKAYLNVADDTEAQSLGIVFSGETTGIGNVAEAAETTRAAIYNLAGQQVAEGYKGVVIRNGKKHMNR